MEKICGGKKHQSAPFLMNQKVLLGLQVGHGFIYSLESTFPSGVGGPATFLFGPGKETKNYSCKIMMDSSIQNDVIRIVQQVRNEYLNLCHQMI